MMQKRFPSVSVPKGEWSILAVLFARHRKTGEEVPLVLSTGVKCLNAKDIIRDEKTGLKVTVSDMHSEALARRGFNLLLLDMIEGDSCKKEAKLDLLIYDKEKGTWRFNKESFELGLFISHGPCGDATIDRYNYTNENESVVKERDEVSPPTKKVKVLQSAALALDVIRGRNEPSRTNVIRTKPGRTDSIPTCSMSCSDKICLWNHCGLQGSLLSYLIPEPIRLDKIQIASSGFCRKSMIRCIIERFSSSNGHNCILESVSVDKESFSPPEIPGSLNPCASATILLLDLNSGIS